MDILLPDAVDGLVVLIVGEEPKFGVVVLVKIVEELMCSANPYWSLYILSILSRCSMVEEYQCGLMPSHL